MPLLLLVASAACGDGRGNPDARAGGPAGAPGDVAPAPPEGSTTDATIPFAFDLVSPAQATGVPLDADLVLSSSKPIDPATLGAVRLEAAGLSLAATVSLEDGARRVRVHPAAPLAPAVEHAIVLGTGLRASNGDSLAAARRVLLETVDADGDFPSVVHADKIVVVGGATFPSDQLVVLLDEGLSPAEARARAAEIATTHASRVAGAQADIGLFVLETPTSDAASLAALAGAVRVEPGVSSVALNARGTLAGSGAAHDIDALPVAPAGGTRWPFLRPALVEAWDLVSETGLGAVPVGIVDAPPDLGDPELAGMPIVHTSHSAWFKEKIFAPFAGNHGTLVARVLLARDGGGGSLTGVLPGAMDSSHYTATFDSMVDGSFEHFVAALKAAANRSRVVTTSVSWEVAAAGGADKLVAFQAALVRRFRKHPGTLFLMAAGNDGADITGSVSTSSTIASNAITVGGTSATDGRAVSATTTRGSGWGAPVTISAPVQTYDASGAPETGTSFSTPMVAGVASLVRLVDAKLVPTELVDILHRTGDPIVTDKPIGPRVNACAAVAEALARKGDPAGLLLASASRYRMEGVSPWDATPGEVKLIVERAGGVVTFDYRHDFVDATAASVVHEMKVSFTLVRGAAGQITLAPGGTWSGSYTSTRAGRPVAHHTATFDATADPARPLVLPVVRSPGATFDPSYRILGTNGSVTSTVTTGACGDGRDTFDQEGYTGLSFATTQRGTTSRLYGHQLVPIGEGRTRQANNIAWNPMVPAGAGVVWADVSGTTFGAAVGCAGTTQKDPPLSRVTTLVGVVFSGLIDLLYSPCFGPVGLHGKACATTRPYEACASEAPLVEYVK